MSTIKKLYLPLFALLLTTTALHALPGDITTIAGGFNTDGLPATEAHFKTPYHIAVNWRGDVYISDLVENRVRKINGETGIITTVAGNGAYDFAGDNGPAIEASLASPRGIWVKGDDLYIADSANNMIRKIDTKGTISTIAGNGNHKNSGDGGPALKAGIRHMDYMAMSPAGELHIVGMNSNVVRKITKDGNIENVAGNGYQGYFGDGGPATKAMLKSPSAIAFDSKGNLFISDLGNGRIRKVDTNGNISTYAGSGTFGWAQDGETVEIYLHKFP